MPLTSYYRSPLDEIFNSAPRALPPVPQLTAPAPAEEDSLLGLLGGKALSGMQYVGDVLDKTFGGRAIRGALAGKPRELASVLPFSDTLGITDYADRTSGQELLRKAGVISGDDGWQNTLAGIGTELALDPSLYLSFGGSALTKAGVAAKKLGTLPETLLGRMKGLSALTPRAAADAARLGVPAAELLNRPLGGLVGLGLPFLDPSVVLGTGQAAQKVAAGLGALTDAAKYSWAGRHASALFDEPVRGTVTAPVQKALRAGQPELRDALAAAREPVGRLYQDVAAAGHNDPAFLRGLFESPGDVPYSPEVLGLRDRAAALLADRNAAEKAAGLSAPLLDDRYAQYFPRQLTQLEREAGGGAGPAGGLGTRLGAMTGREDVWKDIPGGTATIEQMAADPRIAGPNRTYQPGLGRDYIAGQYLGVDMPGLQANRAAALQAPNVASPEALEQAALWKKAGQLTKRLETLDPRRAGPSGAGLFDNHPLLDLLGRTEGSAKAVGNAGVLRGVFTDDAVLAAGAASPDRAVPLTKAIAAAGFDPAAKDLFLQDLVAKGVLPPGSDVKALQGVLLPADVVKDATRLRGSSTASDAVSGVLRGIDSATTLNKAMQTSPWPAFNVRNLTSSTVQSLSAGSDPLALLASMPEMKALREGKVVEGLAAKVPYFQGMTDAQATKELGLMMFSERAAGRGQTGAAARELLGPSGDVRRDLGSLIPGEIPEPGVGDILKAVLKGRTDAAGVPLDTLGERLNPLNTAGVGGFAGLDRRNVTQFAPLVAGREAGDLADDVTRGGMFIERLKSGYSPAAAAAETSRAHFDYSKLTDFERNVMRRLVPYYTWSRNEIPFLAETLGRNPGGLPAQMIRASNDVRQQDGFLPAYLGEGLAVPVGDQGDTRTYLTKLDMPYENPLQLVPAGAGGVRRAAENLAGNLNPLIKAPLELLTGKQFYSGRNLDELYPITGSLPIDQALANSPAGRLITTGRTLADERKTPVQQAVNLLTGARLSDVDMAKQRDLSERDLLTQLMQSDPKFHQYVDYYVRPEDQAALSPEEVAVLRLKKAIEQRRRQAR